MKQSQQMRFFMTQMGRKTDRSNFASFEEALRGGDFTKFWNFNITVPNNQAFYREIEAALREGECTISQVRP